ncbi:alpha/beta hydrolase fold domain-containing protein [Phthorimaea operculella]|nr:alpha/beta hydrolase fold domain-containing protein [Phthorimaea operculella]
MKLIENEWFIEVPWGKLCTVAWGDCHNPPVLVVHGGGDSLASFRPLISQLPTNFYYVGIEFPGHGKSDAYPPGLPVHMLDLPYVIETVRRHFRWESFIYMAHSFAGIIGRLYNLTHPGRIIATIELDQVTPTLGFELPKFKEW